MRLLVNTVLILFLLSFTSCDSEKLIDESRYDVVVFDSTGIEVETGLLTFVLRPPDNEFTDHLISGSWKWSRPYFQQERSGPLSGRGMSDGRVFLSLDLESRVLDVGYSLNGRYRHGVGSDIEGEVFDISIAGSNPNGNTFIATIQ